MKIYYIPPQVGLKGDFSEYKTIYELGTNKIKGYKQSNVYRDKFYINQEHSALQQIHKILPIDSSIDSKGLKHLGIQDAYKFARVNVLANSYVVGTPFEGNIANLNLQGIKILGVLYQIAFGLKILHDNNFFNHSIKPSNILFSRDKNFPLGIRVVLSDLHLTTKNQLLEDCKNREPYFPIFGCSSEPTFVPNRDWKMMVQYHNKMKECHQENPEFLQIYEEIALLRQKNMISLVGQVFFQVVTFYPKKYNWPKLFISNNNTAKLKNGIKNLFESLHATAMTLEDLSLEKQTSLVEKISQLIVNMTDLNHRNRPTANVVLNTLLTMTKDYAPSDYEIIVKNRWTDGYSDWK